MSSRLDSSRLLNDTVWTTDREKNDVIVLSNLLVSPLRKDAFRRETGENSKSRRLGLPHPYVLPIHRKDAPHLLNYNFTIHVIRSRAGLWGCLMTGSVGTRRSLSTRRSALGKITRPTESIALNRHPSLVSTGQRIDCISMEPSAPFGMETDTGSNQAPISWEDGQPPERRTATEQGYYP
jgi:hypothetical protein